MRSPSLFMASIKPRKAKNQYTWKGINAIPYALEELKVMQESKLVADVKLRYNLGNDDAEVSVDASSTTIFHISCYLSELMMMSWCY
ncbi:hypothetical protein L6452_36372 [Arctium lappa]|uniref:Uncharacterized protein n=1 Tax=Arctium lappa TaxID=4217 RepID=A0ACB8Y9H5_ARCLA|nr:hypothetical protein L6452_36372 [Arctium lappa]